MKTRKLRTFGRRTFLAIAAILTLALSACPDDNTGSKNDTPTTITVSFVALADSYPATSIDFSPNTPLPTGVTYIVTDNSTPQKSWNSRNGFNGKITASEHYTVGGDVTFTQTFYFNGVEITNDNSKRTVVENVATFGGAKFGSSGSDTGSVTLIY